MSLLSLDAVTVVGYRVRTGDNTTEASAVSAALLESEELVSEELRRDLPLEERTEVMRIKADGRMYPRAWPLVSCATNTIDGRTLVGGTPDVDQFVALLGSDLPPKATVTYMGGFGPETLPATLRCAIYDLAYSVTHSIGPTPTGTSVSVGDVSVSGISPSEGGIDSFVPGLSARIGKYRARYI